MRFAAAAARAAGGRKRRCIRCAVLGLLCAVALWPPVARAAEYTLGIVPQFEQRKLFENWRPIAAELERRTGHGFTIVTGLGVHEFEKEFLKGRFDFVYMSPYFLSKTARTPDGYLPLVRDRIQVSGLLLVRKGRGIDGPRTLAGRLVAFPTPNALGACMIMRTELKQQFGVEVSPLYVRSVSNVALHVAKGLADAGGVPENGYSLVDPAVRERLEVVHRTQPMPPHAIAAHARVPAADREAVRAALLAFASTEAGREAFGKVPMREPIAASPRDYEVVAKMGADAWYDSSWGD